MTEHVHVHTEVAETQKCQYNKKTIHRINRIQGQLEALKRLIEEDGGTCEERVIQARAIEKGMTSLISHLVECYLVNTARYTFESDPDTTMSEIVRLFELLNN